MSWFFILTIVVVILLIVAYPHFCNYRRNKEIQKKEEELLKRAIASQRVNRVRIDELTEQYKNPDEMVDCNGINIKAYYVPCIAVINGIYVPFKHIKESHVEECEKKEVTTVLKSSAGNPTMKATTKTNGKSLIGRSVVGGLIAGPVGAIIGGATAKRETTFEYDSSSPSYGTKTYITKYYELTIETTDEKYGTFRCKSTDKSEIEKVQTIVNRLIEFSHNQ